MKKIALITGLFMAACMPAMAGSLSSPWDEPEVQAPDNGCGTMWFTGWPICSSDRMADGGDDTFSPTTNTTVETETPDEQCEVTPRDRPKKGKVKKDKKKSNAGRGNGSEGSPDRDPGNSGGRNNGGD